MESFISCTVSTDREKLGKLLGNAVEHLEHLRLMPIDEVSDESLNSAKVTVHMFKCLLFFENIKFDVCNDMGVNRDRVIQRLIDIGLLTEVKNK